jgi:membrane protein implicated in regulation of membrane protease activity
LRTGRVSEWLNTADGLTKSVAAVLGLAATLAAAILGSLRLAAETLGLPIYVAALLAAALLLSFCALLWRSYRRFARESRLEQPDRFTLVATTPESLIGRTEDLDRLVRAVAQNRLVLLDGESGCGKSALVSAGLVPRLRASDGLLPIVLRDWGDDWYRGPLAAALEALHAALSADERRLIGGSSAPDLAAAADDLTAELTRRLTGVNDALGRRPLLIADQFDDHQAQHRREFLDADGNWLTPDDLAARNPFWRLVGAGLRNGNLHLLAVTRADTASGMSCIRFLDPTMTASRTLPRVEDVYLGPLLKGVAPPDADPTVVSNPANGWHELRDQVQADLHRRGAILMQEVRTVLLGLRVLPVLTLQAYRRVGQLEGVQTLVVRRALAAAGEALGGGDQGVRTARELLGALVLPGGPDQPPKAQRKAFEALAGIAGGSEQAARALRVLQGRDIVRPVGGEEAWQLDHDYLSRAVLAEVRRANRWGGRLVEEYARFQAARDSWRRRWAALLPISVQARLAWERLRGRIRYREAAGYARLSSIKPALLVALILLFGWGARALERDLALGRDAQALANRFGSFRGKVAALDVWRAPEPLRMRVFALVREDRALLLSAALSDWPAAHAGVEPERAVEALSLLRDRLKRQEHSFDSVVLIRAYADLARRLADPPTLRETAATLRNYLERNADADFAITVAWAYASLVERLAEPMELREAASALRGRLEREEQPARANTFAWTYAAVAQRLADPAVLSEELAALRSRLEREENPARAEALARAYAGVAERLAEQAVLREEASAMRGRLEREENSARAATFARAYAAVAVRLADPTELREEAKALRSWFEREGNAAISEPLASAYAKVMERLDDPAARREAAEFLRSWLEREENVWITGTLARAYAVVAGRLADPAVLRGRLEREDDPEIAGEFAWVYSEVVGRLADPATLREAAAKLRDRLKRELDAARVDRATRIYDVPLAVRVTMLDGRLVYNENFAPTDALVRAYAEVMRHLADPAVLREETAALRNQLEREGDPVLAGTLARAYAAVAERLSDPAMLRTEAAALRGQLEREESPARAATLAQAYAAVAVQVADRAMLLEAAALLQGRLGRARSAWIASRLAEAYAAVAVRLSDPTMLREAAGTLRSQLEQEPDATDAIAVASNYKTLVQAYAAVARSWLQHPDRERLNEAAMVREILVMAGHPHLDDPTPLLSALEPLAAPRALSDVRSAVAWFVERYRGQATMLRPRPRD